MVLLLQLLSLFFLSTSVQANPVPESIWISTYTGIGQRDDVATSIAIGTDSSIYVSGFETYNSSDHIRSWLRKYNPNGEIIWTITSSDSLRSEVNSIAVDTNIYVVGSELNRGISIRKFNSDGLLQWTTIYRPAPQSAGNSIAVSTDGFIYIAGQLLDKTTSFDAILAKYDNNGLLRWTTTFGFPDSQDIFESVAVSSDGIIVCGCSQKKAIVRKYTVEGSSVLWTRTKGGSGPGTDFCFSVGVDSSGSVYTAGYQWKSSPTLHTEIYVEKSDRNGKVEWITTFPGPLKSSFDRSSSIFVSTDGIYLTGQIENKETGLDILIQKYSLNGVLEWTTSYNQLFFTTRTAHAIRQIGGIPPERFTLMASTFIPSTSSIFTSTSSISSPNIFVTSTFTFSGSTIITNIEPRIFSTEISTSFTALVSISTFDIGGFFRTQISTFNTFSSTASILLSTPTIIGTTATVHTLLTFFITNPTRTVIVFGPEKTFSGIDFGKGIAKSGDSLYIAGAVSFSTNTVFTRDLSVDTPRGTDGWIQKRKLSP